jgi:phytoene dehydrogenase-like protein
MLTLSPDDEDPIRDFTGAIRQFTRMALPVDLTPGDPLEWARLGRQMLPVMIPALQWIAVPLRQFARRFHDPLLRDGLPEFFQLTPPDFPAIWPWPSADMNDRKRLPIGLVRLARSLAARHEALGGQIHKSRVTRILVEERLGRRTNGRVSAYSSKTEPATAAIS